MLKKIIYLIFIQGIFLCSNLSHLNATTFNVAKIIGITSTGEAVILDQGAKQGMNDGDVAEFFFYGGKNPVRIKRVATGRLVQNKLNHSFWHLKNISNMDAIRKNSKLLFMTKRRLMKGRTNTKIKRRQVVLRSDSNIKKYLSEKEEMPENLIYEKSKYDKSDKIHSAQVAKRIELKAENYISWRDGAPESLGKGGIQESKYYDKVRSTNAANVIAENENEDIYESSVEGTIESINYEQANDVKFNRREYDVKTPDRNLDQLQQRDPRWSEDLSDESLRRYFVDSGIIRERKRQKEMFYHSVANEIIFSYSMGTIYQTTVEDDGNQYTSKQFKLGYVYHLVRSFKEMRPFTASLYYTNGISYYDFGGINLKGNETEFQFIFDWYFTRLPSIIHRFAPYIGAGFSVGKSDIEYEYDSGNLRYSLNSIPIINLGVKYRFLAGDENQSESKLGFGFNSAISYERKAIKREIDNEESNIYSELTVNDLKLTIGFGIFF